MRRLHPGSRGAGELRLARKTDREFKGVEYVRNGPPGPMLTLLRSLPRCRGSGGGSRAASNSSRLTALRRDRSAWGASGAAMGRTRPEARVMIASSINRAFGRVSVCSVAGVRRSDTRHSQLPRARSSILLATRIGPARELPGLSPVKTIITKTKAWDSLGCAGKWRRGACP